MAKFPTEVERSVTVQVPPARAYAYLWDVLGSFRCIPGIDRCERVGDDTYRFVYQERSTGPVSMTVRYTARYQGNGQDSIRFAGEADDGDSNTDVDGRIQLEAAGPDATRITVRQMVAPDTPVPRLLQGFARSFVEREAGATLEQHLANIKQALEAAKA
jgi:carbon monoxide dehydrogenase subunit G